MKAIVLSFDKQAGFAELTYKKYMELWEKCPLEFLIPVNDVEKNASYEYFKKCDNIKLINSKPDIRSTMKALLEGIKEDEWIYWCIDDRFPTEIKNLLQLNTVVNKINNGELNEFNGIKLFRWREEITDETIIINKIKFFVQKPKSLFGFWLHSFVKAKVLREIFLSEELDDIYKISDITSCFHPKSEINVFKKILVPEENILLMGEPCIEGEITVNGYEELKKHNCPIPKYKITTQVKEFRHNSIAACQKVNSNSNVSLHISPKTFAHIINPVGVGEDNEFYKIQQVTFAAIKKAWENRGDLSVELLTSQFEEDHSIIPGFFRVTPDLKDSVLDVNSFTKNRKLPFISDILNRALKYSSAEYIVFTNADIIPSPDFYIKINELITAGNVAFTINRRTVNRFPDTPDKLSEIFSQEGKSHPGHDCFIFPRLWIEKFNLGRIIVGAPWLGFSILANMACVGRGINVFQDLKLTRHLGDDQQWMSNENLEYRNFNSYEALNLLADLQRQYGEFSRGGYLSQHVSLAINQVRSAGSIVNYLKKRHDLTPKNGNKRKLIFSVSSGRAGSQYLKTILGSAEEVKSFHEPEPAMSGVFLKDVMINPLTLSYEKRLDKAKTINELLSHYPPSVVYAETNHMFIKTFYDVILESFKECDLYVIVLRRALEKVLASFIKMGYFTDRNRAWPHWMHKVPSENSLLKLIKSFDEMDQYDRAIAYLVDIEMRAQQFILQHSGACKIVEVNLENLQTIGQIENLFGSLGIKVTPYTSELAGGVVNDREDRKKDIKIDTDLNYCFERITFFLKEHRDAGIKIPRLPQFE